MAVGEMIVVDSTKKFTPSAMTVSIQNVNAADSGRVLNSNATMYTNRITRKYKIQLEWWGPNPTETARILQAFAPEYFTVKFPDPYSNSLVTKTFYCGDQSIPVKWWNSNNKRYSKVSFNIIER